MEELENRNEKLEKALEAKGLELMEEEEIGDGGQKKAGLMKNKMEEMEEKVERMKEGLEVLEFDPEIEKSRPL